MNRIFALAFSAALLTASNGLAVTIYDEDVDGDLSGDFTMPTVVTLGFGPNSVSGQMGQNGSTGASNGSDGDFFRFTVPAGAEVTEIFVDEYETTENQSFLGYRGSPFTSLGSTGAIDGFELFSDGPANIIGALTGLPALGPGDHFFWVQETSPVTVDYTLRFTVVPEPAGLLLACLAGLGLAARRR
ncbi:MAG: PEP-CTERM sorting domain-containing protein [Planctomycetota bacterium]